MISALTLMLEILVNRAIWSLGAGLAENAVLLGREQFFPFFVGFNDLAAWLDWCF